MVNGVDILSGYTSDPNVKAIVDAIQNKFEQFLPYRDDNFGPLFLLKDGLPTHTVPPHNNHIHLGVM